MGDPLWCEGVLQSGVSIHLLHVEFLPGDAMEALLTMLQLISPRSFTSKEYARPLHHLDCSRPQQMQQATSSIDFSNPALPASIVQPCRRRYKQLHLNVSKKPQNLKPESSCWSVLSSPTSKSEHWHGWERKSADACGAGRKSQNLGSAERRSWPANRRS